MKSATLAVVALFACGSMGVSVDAQAQARGPAAQELRERARAQDTAETRAEKMAELQTWLGRMVGRFRVVIPPVVPIISLCGFQPAGRSPCTAGDEVLTRFVRPQREGLADCRKIGSGPGVSCVLHFDDRGFQFPAGGPRVILLGLDPDNPGIRLMDVGSADSAARTGRSYLRGDAVSFTLECMPGPGLNCRHYERFRITPDGKRIVMDIRDASNPRPGAVNLGYPVSTVIDFSRVAESTR